MSAEATWNAHGEGEQLWFLGTHATIAVPGDATGGRFALLEFLVPSGASPPLHSHSQDESYVVLEGGLTVVAGDRRFELGPGGAAVVPGGLPHTFRVDSESVRMLLISAPAGIEEFFRDASVPAAEPTLPPEGTPEPSPEELERIIEAHGQAVHGPRLGPGD